jgi:uncharacterized membrane protein YagU involved in acid resistance
MNPKDHLLIFNIAAAVFFSIIIGVMFVFIVELFARYKLKRKSVNPIQKN